MTSRRFEDDDRHEMRQMRRIERERIVPIISRRVEREVDSRNYEELAAARRELDELKQSRVDEEQYKLKQRLAAEKREKEIQELKMRAEYEKQKERNIYELKQQEFKEQKLRQRTAEGKICTSRQAPTSSKNYSLLTFLSVRPSAKEGDC